MLHSFFIKLTHHRSYPLVALVRCEDEWFVCVWQQQHGRLAQLQLELLEYLLLFVAPPPLCILFQQLVEGVGNGIEMQHELPVVGKKSGLHASCGGR